MVWIPVQCPSSTHRTVGSTLRFLYLILIAGLLAATCCLPSLADGSSTFKGKCSGCHTIGKGKLVGPDLAPTKTWADADLEKAIHRMEKTVGPFSPADLTDLITYLKNPGEKATAAGEPAKSETAAAKPESTGEAMPELAAGSVQEGAELFAGKRSFKNAGMPCSACHSLDASGTSLGPNLGKISEKFNDAALLASCEQTPFKVMKAAYANHPVTKQEAAHLVKFFDSLKGQTPGGEKIPVTLCGAAGSVLVLLLVAFGYRNRNVDVRKKLHRR